MDSRRNFTSRFLINRERFRRHEGDQDRAQDEAQDGEQDGRQSHTSSDPQWPPPMPAPRSETIPGPAFNLCQHLETQEIDPQLSSPLFNGRIPSEIRTQIFQFALAEYPSPDAQSLPYDPAVRYDHEPVSLPELPRDPTHTVFQQPTAVGDWLRPDNTRPMMFSIALLQTCRRVYLEAHALPLMQKEHVLYLYRGPDPENTWSHDARVRQYFTRKLGKPSSVPGLNQYDLVRSVRLFTQLYWLEDRDRFWSIVSNKPWFQPIETLHITLRRSDWWDWESNRPPVINPFKGRVDIAEMQLDMLVDDGNPKFKPEAWGLAFEKMPKLKTLIIDFETSEDQKANMEKIVEWAVKWRFPLADDKFLSTEGKRVNKMSWFGTPYSWSHRCTSCGRSQYDDDQQCATCQQKKRLHVNGYGPRLYVWTVAWQARNRGSLGKSHSGFQALNLEAMSI